MSSAEAQIVIRERVEVSPATSARTECGGPGQPPCPDVFCVLPVTDPACTSAEIAVTEDGFLHMVTDRLATRGDLADPDYTVLDPLAGGAHPTYPSSRHGFEVRRDGIVRQVPFSVLGTFRLTSEGAEGADWVRRYDLVYTTDRQIVSVPLAAGDTLTGALWTQLPGSRTPVDHPMYDAAFGPTYMVGRVAVSVGTDPNDGAYDVLQFSDSAWGAPFTTLVGRFGPAPTLRLAVMPDTLAPGDTATVALEGVVGSDGTVVRLAVGDGPDGLPGGFVTVNPELPTRMGVRTPVGEPEITTTVGELDRIRFVASPDIEVARTATLVAEVDGASTTAEVVIEPGTLMVDPGTFSPGEEAGLTFTTTLPGDTPIRLGVGAGAVVTFAPPPAARGHSAVEEWTETRVRTTVDGIADVRIIGNEDITGQRRSSSTGERTSRTGARAASSSRSCRTRSSSASRPLCCRPGRQRR